MYRYLLAILQRLKQRRGEAARYAERTRHLDAQALHEIGFPPARRKARRRFWI